ncbi:hypothetical protein RJ639_002208 [Escallonia herrerae]|uniref:26S protease regulatory subunit 7 n=1 Tax=Escallonia herrerae TaxID=1293975 RepID=A0AA89BLT3_9ASTE|nr:hypothetical protein RJ639_002208 [Escallonia herrerae]
MLEIVNQLDGFDARGNIKVLMATNRPDTLDPALLRPGRLDRKVEFGLPDLESRTQIFKIHTRTMNCERDIRFELLARLCPNSTGADIRSVCTEAGMYAIRARRKTVTEKDFLDAVNKVIKGYQKFSATPKRKVMYLNLFDIRHDIIDSSTPLYLSVTWFPSAEKFQHDHAKTIDTSIHEKCHLDPLERRSFDFHSRIDVIFFQELQSVITL